MLSDYPGTVLLVSHDRDFLDRVASSVIFAEGDGLWREYAGGYTDMLAQRGAGVTARKQRANGGGSEDKRKDGGEAKQVPQKKKSALSFTQQHQLKSLPGEIEKLGKEIAKIQAELEDPDMFAKDPKRFERLMASLAAAETRLTEAEDAWLELEMLAAGEAG
jgi:ATP-binding cassette subfamily F protein uup